VAGAWAALEKASPDLETFEKIVAARWRETGCADEGAPYVIRELLRRLDNPDRDTYAPSLEPQSPESPALAATFLKEDCDGARGLSNAEKARLRAIRDRGTASTVPRQ
jgi:hypothetical protein